MLFRTALIFSALFVYVLKRTNNLLSISDIDNVKYKLQISIDAIDEERQQICSLLYRVCDFVHSEHE